MTEFVRETSSDVTLRGPDGQRLIYPLSSLGPAFVVQDKVPPLPVMVLTRGIPLLSAFIFLLGVVRGRIGWALFGLILLAAGIGGIVAWLKRQYAATGPWSMSDSIDAQAKAAPFSALRMRLILTSAALFLLMALFVAGGRINAIGVLVVLVLMGQAGATAWLMQRHTAIKSS